MAKTGLASLIFAAVMGCSSPESNRSAEQLVKEAERITYFEQMLNRNKFPDEDHINAFLNHHLGLVLAMQETVFGITYDQIPNIETKVMEFFIAGVYDSIAEKIYLSPLAVHGYGFRRTLGHELGHFYTHQLAKKLMVGFDSFILGDTEQQYIARLLISEGIGEYFGQTLHPPAAVMECSWPNHLLGWWEKEFYNCGYKLVKPILDLDVMAGIEYLLANQPASDLQDLPSYQIKAIEEVSRKLKLKENR